MVLPSGKSIDVTYFADQLAADPTAPSVDQTPETGLHICECCASTLVYPLEWSEASASHWEVTLRCPNCEWRNTGVHTQSAVERFDRTLDRGTEALVDDLKRLSVANMEDEIDRFAAALDADLILPEDF